jgi:hypothetical protein
MPTAPNGTPPTTNPRRRLGRRRDPHPFCALQSVHLRLHPRHGHTDPAGDSIAIFKNVGQGTPGEKLQLMTSTQVFTGLDQLRGMQFGGEDECLNAGQLQGWLRW